MPEPANLDTIQERLSRRRDSLSSENFKEQDFKDFVRAEKYAHSEAVVVQDVIPIIEGKAKNPKYRSMGKFFNQLEFLFDDVLPAAVPDI